MATELTTFDAGELMPIPSPRNQPLMYARETPAMKLAEIHETLQTMRQFINDDLKDGQDYGIIPGTPKPCLWLPGAQKIIMLFNGYAMTQVANTEFEGGHVEFRVTTKIIDRATGQTLGYGLGSCTSLESKYRYRNAQRACPECKNTTIGKSKEEYGGGWYCNAKKGGCGAGFKKGDKRIEDQEVGQAENPNPFDIRNTILKMAAKRSLVHAASAIASVSDFFTQDLEDMDLADVQQSRPAKPAAKQAEAPRSEPPAPPKAERPKAAAKPKAEPAPAPPPPTPPPAPPEPPPAQDRDYEPGESDDEPANVQAEAPPAPAPPPAAPAVEAKQKKPPEERKKDLLAFLEAEVIKDNKWFRSGGWDIDLVENHWQIITHLGKFFNFQVDGKLPPPAEILDSLVLRVMPRPDGDKEIFAEIKNYLRKVLPARHLENHRAGKK